MIPTYQSTSTATGAGTSAGVTAPTGIALGDLLIATVLKKNTNSVTVPSGFSSLKNLTFAAIYQLQVFTKIADSGDVASGTFTFSWTGSSRYAVNVTRIDGQAPTNYIGTEGVSWTSNNDVDISVSNSLTLSAITPDFQNSLIFFVIGIDTDSSMSGYAMSADNPTWTERYCANSAGSNMTLAIATAFRPQTTSSGSISVNIATPPTADKASGIAIFIKQNYTSNSLTLLGVS